MNTHVVAPGRWAWAYTGPVGTVLLRLWEEYRSVGLGEDEKDLLQDVWDYVLYNYLPSGSGWDLGTRLSKEKSGKDRVYLTGAWHHMNEHGFYTRWTDHAVVLRATPDRRSYDFRITGRNVNGVKDYLDEVFHYAFQERVSVYVAADAEGGTFEVAPHV